MSTMPPLAACRISLVACLLIGVAIILFAIVLVPTMPHFRLDGVLTPHELADPPTREATLALLKKTNRNEWVLWFLAGLAVTVTAGVGLFASRRKAS